MGPKAQAAANVAVVVIVTIIVTAIVYPVPHGGGRRGPSKCLRNMKQIGVALALYAADHHDHFPADSWNDEVVHYIKDPKVLTCDVLDRQDKEWGYAMHSEVAGKQLSSIPEPKYTITSFETDALAKDVVANLAARSKNRHGQGSLVCRVDSSCRHLPAGRTR